MTDMTTIMVLSGIGILGVITLSAVVISGLRCMTKLKTGERDDS